MPYSDLCEIAVQNRSRTLERTAWIGESTATPATAFVFLDGELYLERVRAMDVLGRLRATDQLPDYAALFLSHGGSAARHVDFVCCPQHASLVVEDVVERMRQDYDSVRRFVLVGLSLSGLAAAYIATRYPSVFCAAVCQSPSFWWEGGRFAEDVPAAPPPGPEFWICVGNQETATGIAHPPSGLRQELSQVAGCAAVVAALKIRGYPVHFRTYDGGHDPDCWRYDLELALPWTCCPRARSQMDSGNDA